MQELQCFSNAISYPLLVSFSSAVYVILFLVYLAHHHPQLKSEKEKQKHMMAIGHEENAFLKDKLKRNKAWQLLAFVKPNVEVLCAGRRGTNV